MLKDLDCSDLDDTTDEEPEPLGEETTDPR
jgi:hypothetical protein